MHPKSAAFLNSLALATLMGVASTATAEISEKDKMFVQKAGQAGHAEVTAGKIAGTKASSDEVRKFGAQMVEDHGKAGDELKTIAQGKSLPFPAEPDAAHKAMAAKLESATQGTFDRIYVAEAGVADHKAAVALFSDEASNGTDPEIKAFAQKTLPTIQHHYEMAIALNKKTATK